MSRRDATPVYFTMVGASAFLRSTMYLVITIYYVLTVHMNALELVLVGTLLELSYFIVQMPTGMFADVFSRKLSIVFGWAIVGAAFATEGLIPSVAVILAAQAACGVGEAFIDGAESAWLADEVGEEQYGSVLLRGSQIGQIMGIAGILIAVPLGSIRLSLPVVAGGITMIAMSAYFARAMPERGFAPVARDGLGAWRAMTGTLRRGITVVRASPILLTILGTQFFIGGGSEGFDRLWEAHVIRDIHLPGIGSLAAVVWFAALAIAGSAVSYGANHLMKPRLGRVTGHQSLMARWLIWLNLVYVACVIGFALSGSFVLAIVFLMARTAVATPSGLISSVWYNQSIPDPQIRATIMSMSGQSNALGQWIGGPSVGALGNAIGIWSAILAAGLIGLPNSALFAVAGRHRDRGAAKEAAPEAIAAS